MRVHAHPVSAFVSRGGGLRGGGGDRERPNWYYLACGCEDGTFLIRAARLLRENKNLNYINEAEGRGTKFFGCAQNRGADPVLQTPPTEISQCGSYWRQSVPKFLVICTGNTTTNFWIRPGWTEEIRPTSKIYGSSPLRPWPYVHKVCRKTLSVITVPRLLW